MADRPAPSKRAKVATGQSDPASRRRKASSKVPASRPAPLSRAEAIQALVGRANAGSAHALQCLRRLLDTCSEIWEHVGDLSRLAEETWIELIAGKDHLALESVKRQIAQMKQELAGPHPTAMERLLIDQVAACWLAIRHAEIESADASPHSLGQATFRFRHAESAQKRYLASLKTLASLRARVPQGMAPINQLCLYSATPPKGKRVGQPS